MVIPIGILAQFAANNAVAAGQQQPGAGGALGALSSITGGAVPALQILSGIQARRAATRAYRSQKSALQKNAQNQFESLRRGTAQGYSFLNAAEAAVGKGYKDAKANAAVVNYGTKQDVLAREKENKSTASQSAVSRGLYNTSAYDAVSRGITSDTSRTLANVDSSLANLYAQLSQAQGRDLADINTQRATLATNNAQAQLGIFGQQFNQIANQQFQSQSPDLSGLLALLAGKQGVNKLAQGGILGAFNKG